jgi:hypothetical protein
LVWNPDMAESHSAKCVQSVAWKSKARPSGDQGSV